MEMSQTYSGNPKLDKIIINELLLLGELDTLAHFANNRVINSDIATQEEKDDAILVCVEAGCKPELIISHIGSFIKPNPERLQLVEETIYKYFIRHKDDSLFLKIADAAGYENIAPLLDRIRAEAPDTVADLNLTPKAEPIAEEEPAIVEEPVEIDDAVQAVDGVALEADEPIIETFTSDTDAETIVVNDVEVESHMDNTATDELQVEQIDLDVF